MPIKTDTELSESHKNLWKRAQAAFEARNFGYVVTLLSEVVRAEPEFLVGRQLLRKAEIQLVKGKKAGFLSLDTSGLGLSGLKLGGKQKDPEVIIQSAEKTLETDPFNVPANLALRDAAEAMGFVELATFALETLVEGHPKDPKILHMLGAHYTKIELHEKAIEVYNRILSIAPHDLQAAKLGKDASARASIRAEGWDDAGEGITDYRKLIRNSSTASSLEAEGRMVKTKEVIEQQLAELNAQFEEQPESVDISRKIAQLCEQKEDYALAAKWFEYAAALTKNADAGLVRKVVENNLRVIDIRIRELQTWLTEAGPDHENASSVQAELDALKHEREVIMISEARKRVERNPTDLTLRFELGEHLVADEAYDQAIPELQKALNNPNTRVRAAALLGTCYEAKGMDDLAIEMYTEASTGLSGMDATKKDVLYKMALLYERLGQQDKYLDALKLILRADYGYRDVSARVEASYNR